MYLRILKKDLKRKKTMNVILLLFITLAAMFMAVSANNILTVMSGTDYYLDKAGVRDYVAITLGENGNISSILDKTAAVTDYTCENLTYSNKENFKINGGTLTTGKSSTLILMPIGEAKLIYFGMDNEPLTDVEKGCVYISGSPGATNAEIGDEIAIDHNGVTAKVKVAGYCKDALLGSDFMGNTRFIMNDEDYKPFAEDETLKKAYSGRIFYIDAEDTAPLERALADSDGILFNGDRNIIRMCYVMEMIVAAILLIFSVCLIFIAFIVLRFTISFTLAEELREIGVMKAIGIPNRKIRGLYTVKYLALSVVGSAIGFALSIPFGKAMIDIVSEKMVLGNDAGLLINAISCVLVLVIVLLFSYGCTRRVKKSSPLDAIRSGQTGERFRKKSPLHLSRSRLSACGFTALNDVLSSPKRFAALIITFALSLCLVLTLAVTADTLQSDSLATLFGTTRSDLYLSNSAEFMKCMSENGKEKLQDVLQNMENILAENGMPAKCHIEVQYRLSASHGDNTIKTVVQQGVGAVTCDEYEYLEGTAPQNSGEIAVTRQTAEKLGAAIGDTITLASAENETQYIITAYFQTMNNLGDCIRLYQDVDLYGSQIGSGLEFQIDFTDNPDEKTIAERKEAIAELFPDDKIKTPAEFSSECTGVGDTILNVKNFILFISLAITALVAVLMERSFVAKEKAEIAMLKAVGFTSRAVIKIHTLRFAAVGIISSVLGIILTIPIVEFAITPLFSMMGAGKITFRINPLEICLIYPIIVLVTTLVSAFLTAQYTRTIHSSDTANIE